MPGSAAHDAESPRLRASSITVTTGRTERLIDVSIDVQAGSIHALVGANGSGKSTLLGALAGDVVPSQGQVTVEGKPWSAFSAREAGRCRALLAQDTPLAFPFTVRDVVTWGRLPWRGVDTTETDDEVVDAVITEHGLGMLADRPVPSLSGGERARVHLARVLAQRAPILLLDEADAALDLAGQAHLDDAVRRRRDAGDAIVIVSHDLGRVAAIADQVTVLSHGRVAAQGGTGRTLTAQALSHAYGVTVVGGAVDGRQQFWVPLE